MLPLETRLACFPGLCAARGALALRAPTLAHMVALDALGVDLDGINAGNCYVAAWILSLDADEIERAVAEGGPIPHVPADPEEAVRGVREAIRLAFLPMIEPQNEGGAPVGNAPTGLGWPLELAEWFAHEYRCGLDEALNTPLARVFAMMACSRQRNGAKHGGPDYYERAALPETLAQLKAMKEKVNNG